MFGYKLSHIFRKRYNFKKVENIRLEYAFEVEGIKYFEPSDLNAFPWQRCLSMTNCFNKLQLGLYPSDLERFFEIVDGALTGQNFNLTTIINLKRLNDVMKVRMSSPFRPQEIMWELASIIFMDETESPIFYDAAYGEKKIEFWKKHKDVNNFFLQLPLQRLIPFLPASTENSQIFTETIKELSKIEKDISSQTLPNLYAQQKLNLKNRQSQSSVRATGRNSKK